MIVAVDDLVFPSGAVHNNFYIGRERIGYEPCMSNQGNGLSQQISYR